VARAAGPIGGWDRPQWVRFPSFATARARAGNAPKAAIARIGGTPVLTRATLPIAAWVISYRRRNWSSSAELANTVL
jgi:hypothetical protein